MFGRHFAKRSHAHMHIFPRMCSSRARFDLRVCATRNRRTRMVILVHYPKSISYFNSHNNNYAQRPCFASANARVCHTHTHTLVYNCRAFSGLLSHICTLCCASATLRVIYPHANTEAACCCCSRRTASHIIRVLDVCVCASAVCTCALRLAGQRDTRPTRVHTDTPTH